MPGVGAEGPGALAPPNANATKAPPSGFGADTTKVTAPGVGAEGALTALGASKRQCHQGTDVWNWR